MVALVLPFHLLPLFLDKLAIGDELLGCCSDTWILVVQERVELSAAFPKDASVIVDASFHVAQGLSVLQLLAAQLRAIATQMPLMALAGELLIGPGSSTAPAEVASAFFVLLTGHRLV